MKKETPSTLCSVAAGIKKQHKDLRFHMWVHLGLCIAWVLAICFGWESFSSEGWALVLLFVLEAAVAQRSAKELRQLHNDSEELVSFYRGQAKTIQSHLDRLTAILVRTGLFRREDLNQEERRDNE